MPGELAYYDNSGVVCRCWNWRDGQRTMITDDTTCEFIAMECVEAERKPELEKAIDELSELLQKYVGAEIINKQIINSSNREMMIIE